MNFKKILNLLIFFAVIFSTVVCPVSVANTNIEQQKKETREKIDRLKWLESLETNKLYNNQRKLESATTKLTKSIILPSETRSAIEL